jgi:solute carrier family 25 (adenine nucleotide translocator) protein 4/5/6/31
MTLEPNLPQLSWGERIASAQFISVTAGTLIYPFDSVRRRMMMQAGVVVSERLYRNSFQCISLIAQREGIRGFYLGLGPNILRSVGGALLLVAYDTFKILL